MNEISKNEHMISDLLSVTIGQEIRIDFSYKTQYIFKINRSKQKDLKKLYKQCFDVAHYIGKRKNIEPYSLIFGYNGGVEISVMVTFKTTIKP